MRSGRLTSHWSPSSPSCAIRARRTACTSTRPVTTGSARGRGDLAALPGAHRVLLAVQLLVPLHARADQLPRAAADVRDVLGAYGGGAQAFRDRVDDEVPLLARV